jgi:hypothetical protein
MNTTSKKMNIVGILRGEEGRGKNCWITERRG